MNSELSNLQFIQSESLSDLKTSDLTNQVRTKPKVTRVLRWFEKEGENLVGETTITNVNLECLQKLFGISSDNPMYDCYLVESFEQINYLQKIVDFELDLNSYNYFVECDQV